MIRQLKSCHKYKTKPTKADTTILGNKTLLRHFRKYNNTTINEITDLLEYQTPDFKKPCLLLSMMLIAFDISHTQHTRGHSGSEKTYSNFTQNFYFPNAPNWIKVLCNDCIICQLNKPYPNQKQIATKQDFKGQSLYFNHRISFDTKGPISPSSEGNSYIMVIVDAFTHYVALNPVPHCNAYYAYTTLYEHWIAKFGLPEILVTDNGTEFINNEIITLCHLYNIKHKPRTSHAPWTNGLVEGMNRSLQEYLRCIINGNDTRYTEWSTDVKLFPLSYKSQITTTFSKPPFRPIQSHSQHTSRYTPSQVTPTYSPFNNERSTNNSPDNIQLSEELDNFITLQQQLLSPHTLTIHQLSSTITSSNPPTPTPISDYTPSLTLPSNNPTFISPIYTKSI